MSIYYYPEQNGLKIIGEIGDGGGYDWSLLVVWQDESGRLFYDQDSGCSCYGPWDTSEGGGGKESLTEITEATWDQFVRDVRNFYYSDKAKKDSLLRKVRYRRRK